MSRISKNQQRKNAAVKAGGGFRPAASGALPSGGFDGKVKWSWEIACVCGLLVILVFLVFGQTVRHGFVNFDDDLYVYENPMISHGLTMKGMAWAFTHSHAANWHPITTISEMLDCQFYGLWPGGHHLTNVLLHAAAAVLLFLMLWEMTGALWRCAFVAAVFAVHPLHVESVAWIAERKDVLSGVFFMLTLWAYARYARNPKSRGLYAMVALWLALGLMSKPMLVTVPFVLLLLDFWPLGRLRQKSQLPRLILEKLPLLALSVISCIATIIAQKEAILPEEHMPLSLRSANAVVAYCIYLEKTVYPAGLAVFHPILKNGWPAWQVVAAVLFLAAITAGAWVLRRKQPWLLAGWLWYLGMLVPVIGFLQVGGQSYADRYMYLPQIGLCFAATWALADWSWEWRSQRVAMGGAAAAVLCVLATAAHRQTSYWRDSETLWTRSIACINDNYLAYSNLGVALFDEGRIEEAAADFREALRINPGFADAHKNLGSILFQQGQTDDAIGEYRETLRINPASEGAHASLGDALLQKGRTGEAITEYHAALQIDPADAQTHDNLGSALLGEGQTEKAVDEYREALRINPANMQAHYNLGNVLFQQRDMEEAIAEMRKALELEPANASVENTLAWMLATVPLASLRDGPAAVRLAAQAAQSTRGGEPNILRTLAVAYAETGEFTKAVQTAQNALQIAEARSDTTLAESLRREIKLYEAGRRFQSVP